VGNSQLQHYLPRVYLKGFAEPGGHLWRYDRLDASCKRLPLGVIAAEKDLYSIQDGGGISQALENELFSPIDGSFGPMMRKVEKGESLSVEEFKDLAIFVAYLLVRTPECIRGTELRFRQLDTQVGGMSDTVKYYSQDPRPPEAQRSDSFVLASEQSDQVSKNRGEAVRRNEVLRALVSSGMQVADALLDLQWSFVSAPTGRSFIVGDAPFAIVPPRSHDTDLEGVGPLTAGAETYVPLSASLCARITTSGIRIPVRQLVDGAMVRAINLCQVLNSERYLYSSSETLLGKLTAGITASGLNFAVVVTREATSVSSPNSSLIHTFTKSKIPSEWAERLTLISIGGSGSMGDG
jgi:hypothetical protein